MPKRKTKKTIQRRDENGLRLLTYRRFKEGVDFEAPDADRVTAIIDFVNHCNKIHNTGRPPTFETVEELQGAVDAFWEIIAEQNRNGVRVIPDVEGFCSFINISRQTLNEWEHGRGKQAGLLSDTVKRLKNHMAYVKKQLALTGNMPPIVFATDFNNNHGYTQKTEHIITPGISQDSMSHEEIAARYLEE